MLSFGMIGKVPWNGSSVPTPTGGPGFMGAALDVLFDGEPTVRASTTVAMAAAAAPARSIGTGRGSSRLPGGRPATAGGPPGGPPPGGPPPAGGPLGGGAATGGGAAAATGCGSGAGAGASTGGPGGAGSGGAGC